MFLNSISTTSFNAVVPLKKGQITLKLTAKEKAEIEALQKRITELDLGIYSMEKLIQSKNTTINKRNIYQERICSQKETIQELKNAIREIKINRYNKQKARAAAKDAKKLDINA